MTIFSDLTTTFEAAEQLHPDLMMPYSEKLSGELTDAERIEIMREGLRNTFRDRFPMADNHWPSPAASPDLQSSIQENA